ncbi:MAG: DUF456 domain-containing protein [Elusimicrobia bacterium]|nr:DUF456 domain-containing protein [Elusimicrobiota bacterium]
MPEVLVWILAVLLIALGLAGAILPGLPGAPLILLAAVVHKVFLPAYLSWWIVGALAFLAILSIVLDAALAAAGGKKFGASNWGVLGAGLGATAGIFFGPLGLIGGAIAGAVILEVGVAGKQLEPALKAGAGAALGILASTAGKAAVALLMAALFALDCFF